MNSELKLFTSIYPARDDIDKVYFLGGAFVEKKHTHSHAAAVARVNAAWWAWSNRQSKINDINSNFQKIIDLCVDIVKERNDLKSCQNDELEVK